MARRSNRTSRTKWLTQLLGPAASGPPAIDVAPDAPLVVCRACGRDFVYPMDWHETADGRRWWLLLRCGGCQHRRELEIDDAQAADFDHRLERQIAAIRRAARRLELERMSADIDTFTEALRRNLIDAGDFGR